MLNLALLLPLLITVLEGPGRMPEGPGAVVHSREELPGGWERVELVTGTWVELYGPPAGELGEPGPGVLFLHGGGALPANYRSLLGAAAAEVGMTIALPKSSDDGDWGYAGDSQAVAESLALLRAEGADPRRVGIAGHAAGGAYAYLQAYLGESRFSGVLSLGAPYRPVPELPEGYLPPIRMYYGDLDRDYREGGSDRLRDQWEDLGVDAEIVVVPDRGKNDLTVEQMIEGFEFLAIQRLPNDAEVGGICEEGPTVLCLFEGRFAVEATWTDFSGNTGPAQIALRSERSGLFWFFTPTNWEVLIKVLDGCDINEHYWVFGAATTTVAFEIRVTDVWTERTAIYTNPSGRPAEALTDVAALATCP